MKHTCRCLIFFLAISSFGGSPNKISSIEGNVTLNSLTPLSGVTIGVDSTTRDTHVRTTTNSAGYYLFEQIRPGPYTVWAEAKGYGCILIPRLIVPRGEAVRQDFNFIRARRLTNDVIGICAQTLPK